MGRQIEQRFSSPHDAPAIWRVPRNFLTGEANDKHQAHVKRHFIKSSYELNWETRVVLGLLQMGLELPVMVRILGILPGEATTFDAFLDTLFDTDEPVITRCIRDGLPPEGAAKLSHGRSLKCPICSQQIKSVPCVACNKVESDAKINEDSFQAEVHNLPLRVSRRKTNELPGTSGKISVMRNRIKAGLSPFSPRDAMRSGTDGQENTDVFWPA